MRDKKVVIVMLFYDRPGAGFNLKGGRREISTFLPLIGGLPQ
jgi:hypothetical protein